MITREVDLCNNGATKGEGNNNSSDVKVNLPSKTAGFSSSSRPTTSSLSSWTRLKDPRIVRVSRAFGGKDRHSKVCTVRGLRDRRVRLSVPTAIQLYDLQERLGLSQPSKVVDWLLDVAKHDIDQLPPLQFPPRIFDPFLHPAFPAPPPSNTAPAATSSANDAAPFNSSVRWDPLNHHHHHHHNGVIGSVHQKPEVEHFHNYFNNVVLSSPASLPLQQYSFFHPTASASPPEFDLKNMINFQMLMSSSSQHAPPPQIHSIKPMQHFLHSHHETDKNNNEEEQ